MHMVRHQTVRKNCKPFSPRRTTKMPRYHRCGSFAAEVLVPTIRAERQEITVRSAIVEAGKTGEAGHDCAPDRRNRCSASVLAGSRLDATDARRGTRPT